MTMTASYNVDEKRNSNENKKMLQSNSTSPKHKGLRELERWPQSLLCRCDRVTKNSLREHFSCCTVPEGQSPLLGGGEAGAQDAEIGGNRGERIGEEQESTQKWNEAINSKPTCPSWPISSLFPPKGSRASQRAPPPGVRGLRYASLGAGGHFLPKPPRSENKCGKMQATRSEESVRAEVEVMQRLQRLQRWVRL